VKTKISSPWRRLRRGSVLALALGASIAAGAVSATAATTAAPATASAASVVRSVAVPSGTASATVHAFGASATVVKLSPADTINCTLQVNYPHESGHNPGQVNVTATITCGAPVAHLDMYAALYFNGNLVSSGHTSNSGKNYLMAQANHNCSPGDWEGGATGAVTFPPGYEPPTSDFGGEVWSPVVYIGC